MRVPESACVIVPCRSFQTASGLWVSPGSGQAADHRSGDSRESGPSFVHLLLRGHRPEQPGFIAENEQPNSKAKSGGH